MSEDVIGRYFETVMSIYKKIKETQVDSIKKVAAIFAKSILKEGLVHIYGSGHSRMAVEEMFPRYGSFPGFHSIVELSTSNHSAVVGCNGQRQAMFIENAQGLAEEILKNFVFRPYDSFLLISTSGVGCVTVEMAMGAKKRGLTVVALTGVENSKITSPKLPSGTKLMDVADIVIDICVPPGDAVVNINDLAYPVGPVSTISNTIIINMIKVEVARILTENNQPPLVLTSANFIGKEASKKLFEATYNDYRKRISKVYGG